ncbi:MAG: SIMPL domain-containing protein [Clostridiales bacterium]|nr:SIMPL domain-containing protein [Clostridiales bacterium]
MKTIRITGKGNLKVRPDTTRITLTLNEVRREYADALRVSSEKTESLRDLLSGFGLARTDLKTLNFSVDTEYESYREKGEYKQRFIGYRYRHVMKVEFPSDNERLGKILYGLSASPLSPEFRISYVVSDPEAKKNELLEKAVQDARTKAEVLTRAAGVTLKDIWSIDYSWGEVDFEVRPMNELPMLSKIDAEASLKMDIEPDDIDMSDTVTVTWEVA